jgi:hypothetical protein
MLYHKKIFLICVLIISTLQVNAQYSGIDIYAGAGMPLYGEKSYLEKNLFIPSNQPCPPLTRPGYFDKGSPNFTIGALASYRLGGFSFRGGINYTVYQIETWADSDSALKYAIPICPDPPVSNIQRYHTINLPIGISYHLNRWEFSAFYAIPIVTRDFVQTTVVSGEEWGSGATNFWFYERASSYEPIPHYIQLLLGFNLNSSIQIVGFYQFNEARFLNHFSIGLDYYFRYEK